MMGCEYVFSSWRPTSSFRLQLSASLPWLALLAKDY